jgi:hypothetical protein
VLNVLPAFFLAAVIGFIIYQIDPLVGPVFAFEGLYPDTLPDANHLAAPLSREEPRNCMPSLHTGWSLLIWWNSRGFAPWVRVMAGVCMVLTILATVGYGAHYVFDLVVAFPSTLIAQSACLVVPPAVEKRRWVTVLVSVGVTAGWLFLLLQPGLPILSLSPVLTCIAALLTVVGCLWLEHSLYRVTRSDSNPPSSS